MFEHRVIPASVPARRSLFIATGLVFASACGPVQSASAPRVAPPVCATLSAMPPLPVETVRVVSAKGMVSFKAEIADDDAERERGLMCRVEMADDHGMIFDFQPPRAEQFWMKNTVLPLDMLFVGANGRILDIVKQAKPFDETAVPTRGPVTARAVIEINGGLADKLGLKVGDQVQDSAVFGNSRP